MLKVKIARTWEEQERGLGGVKYMPEDEGMLFEFDSPRRLSFWGKDTYIPLDIAFVTGDIITKIAHIEPFNLKPVYSDLPAAIAIEANAGYFKRNGIRAGDHIDVTDRLKARVSAYLNCELDANHCVIRFTRDGHIIEGHSSRGQKEIVSLSANFKVSQLVAPSTGKVEKKHEPQFGEPMGQGPKEQVDPMNLPVLNVGEIGAKLEDDLEQGDEQQGQPEAEQPQEGQPEEIPQPEEPEKEYPVFPNVFAASDWAQQNSEVMRIAYVTTHGKQLVRDIEPHGQFHSESTHRQILVTFDETVGDIRAFILQNIGSWSFVGRQFDKKFVVRG